jgi:serine/threonine protein kinase
VKEEVMIKPAQEVSDTSDRRARSPDLSDGPGLKPGDGFAKCYEIKALLGTGGMGVVYRALDHALQRDVALKVIAGQTHQNLAKERFLRERRALGRLNHDNVVRAFHAGETDEGQLFLVMELVDGRSLAEILQAHGRLPVADACELARQAALGLKALHEAMLVHRDVKPQNLMLTPRGGAKLLDLGLALLIDQSPGSITGTDLIPGSPDYMAPEQARDPSAATTSADLYGLGCVLYCLLAGRPPFGDERHQPVISKLTAHQSEPAPPITGLRPELSEYPDLVRLLDRLLAKDPVARPADPRAVAEALAPLAVGHDLSRLFEDSSPADPETITTSMVRAAPAPASPSPRRWPSRVGLASIGVVILAAVVGGVLRRSSVPPTSSGRPIQREAAGQAPAPPTPTSTLPSPVLPSAPDPPSRTLQAVPGTASPSPVPSPAAPLRIVSFEVAHFLGDSDQREGTIGVHSWATRFNDHVRVTAHLDTEGYCYLIALNADGEVQFCPKARETARPSPTADVVYPAGDNGYYLDDDTGLQGFVLVASRKPLPAYAEWPGRSDLRWEKVGSAGVWRFDGRDYKYLGNPRRGSERPVSAPVPTAFEAVCRFLRRRPDVEAIQALAFPVLPAQAAGSPRTPAGEGAHPPPS